MRQADDLSDDESLTRRQRRANLDVWLAEWHAVCDGAASSNPAFIAARDATERFHIPLSLFDELVAGVSMDSETDFNRAEATGPDTYCTIKYRSLSLLLPRGVGRGARLHPHLWL